MRHHILVKWNEQAPDHDQLRQEIASLFQALLEVPGIHHVDVLPSVIDRPNRYDLLVLITMDKDALPAYDGCAAHHAFKETYTPYMEKKAIFDCD